MSQPPSRTEFGGLADETRALAGQHEEIKARLDVQDKQLQHLEVLGRRHEKQIESQGKELHENTQATRRIEANTKDLLDGWNALQGALTVLEGVGRLAKPVGAIVGTLVAIGAAWAAFKHWVWS